MKAILERALVINEREYGPDHVEVAITLGSLGNAYGDLGDHTKKKAILERVLVINEREYGPDHVEVAITLYNLGLGHNLLGDDQECSKCLLRAAGIFEARGHPYAAQARSAHDRLCPS